MLWPPPKHTNGTLWEDVLAISPLLALYPRALGTRGAQGMPFSNPSFPPLEEPGLASPTSPSHFSRKPALTPVICTPSHGLMFSEGVRPRLITVPYTQQTPVPGKGMIWNGHRSGRGKSTALPGKPRHSVWQFSPNAGVRQRGGVQLRACTVQFTAENQHV